jgi:tRNA(Ile)-lysidine synthase
MAATPTPPSIDLTGSPDVAVAVAYSGGRDSTALLHATARIAAQLGGVHVWALHVHHGLSVQADGWLAHAQAQCALWAAQGLPVSLLYRQLHLQPRRGDSIEALAREARYRALGEMAREAGCELVLLAHHRRDQAETFVLQALRGAGVAGLSAMPREVQRGGLCWARPWLAQSRVAVQAYVAQHQLSYIDDDSNTIANQSARQARTSA